MKITALFALGFLAAACSGGPVAGSSEPALSLQPLLKSADCEAVPELLGTWNAGSDLTGTWAIKELPGHIYRLLGKGDNAENSHRPAFDICAANLGSYMFFDATFRAMEPDGQKPVLTEDNHDMFWLPLHLIGRLDIESDALHFRLLSSDWLQEEWQSGRVELAAGESDTGEKFLTAASKELKEFAARYAADAEAFSCSEDFARLRE
jgi:hypothetical protein